MYFLKICAFFLSLSYLVICVRRLRGSSKRGARMTWEQGKLIQTGFSCWINHLTILNSNSSWIKRWWLTRWLQYSSAFGYILSGIRTGVWGVGSVIVSNLHHWFPGRANTKELMLSWVKDWRASSLLIRKIHFQLYCYGLQGNGLNSKLEAFITQEWIREYVS